VPPQDLVPFVGEQPLARAGVRIGDRFQLRRAIGCLPAGQVVQEPGLPNPVVIVLVVLSTQPQVLCGIMSAVVPRLVALCATVVILSSL